MKKGVKRKKARSKRNDLFSKRNIAILVVVLVLAYFLISSGGDGSEEEGLASLRTSIKTFFVRLFGIGGCDSDADCPNGKFCDGLTELCGITKTSFDGNIK